MKAPPLIDMSILTRGAVDLYALFEWELTIHLVIGRLSSVR